MGKSKSYTESLMVGQIVYMVSGAYFRSGKVIAVTADGVDVDMRYESTLEIWKFDRSGKACDSRSVGYVPEPFEFDGVPSTFEGGPWELYGEEDMINKERERKRKDQERCERLSELLKAQQKFSKSLGSSIRLIRLDI